MDINEIDLGWGRKPLSEQLAGLKFKYDDDVKMADMDTDGALRLHIRGMITDKMFEHAIKNIVKRLKERLITVDKPS